jgi:hypothetical protein
MWILCKGKKTYTSLIRTFWMCYFSVLTGSVYWIMSTFAQRCSTVPISPLLHFIYPSTVSSFPRYIFICLVFSSWSFSLFVFFYSSSFPSIFSVLRAVCFVTMLKPPHSAALYLAQIHLLQMQSFCWQKIIDSSDTVLCTSLYLLLRK